jgi:4-amino-4-deoxy-L-arabinose transferase-like glycosyltransferase
LITQETPIVATMTGMALLFWIFLRTGDRRAFIASAALAGLAVSCKYTVVLAPLILGLLWGISRWRDGERRPSRLVVGVTGGMVGFLAIMCLTNFAITGGATIAMSERTGSHPSFDGKFGPTVERWIRSIAEARFPQELVGFARQVLMQRAGAPAYLFGEVRNTGWSYYYLVALAVKVPLTFWLILAIRAALTRRIPSAGRDWMLPIAAGAFVMIASVGSTRNLGVRYMLPVAPLAIVWISGMAEGQRWSRRLIWAGLAAQALAIVTIHPYELSSSTPWRVVRSAADASYPTPTSTGPRAFAHSHGSNASIPSSAT